MPLVKLTRSDARRGAYLVEVDGRIVGRVVRRRIGSYPWDAEPAGDDPRPIGTIVLNASTPENVQRWCRAAGRRFKTRAAAVKALVG